MLLPPSETKRSGGRRRPVDLGALALPALAPQREAVVDALVALSADEAERVARAEARRHAAGRDRRSTLRCVPARRWPRSTATPGCSTTRWTRHPSTPSARAWLGRHVLIHSAPFGPVGALDPIPAYRLGAAASLPGCRRSRRVWADAVTAALGAASDASCSTCAPRPTSRSGRSRPRCPSAYVRVVADGADGAVRALNHFNKHAKGALVRRLALERPRIGSRAVARAVDGCRRACVSATAQTANSNCSPESVLTRGGRRAETCTAQFLSRADAHR